MIENYKIGRVSKESRFAFCDIRNITFKSGLNIMLGANTSGKSTILNTIKIWNGIETGYFSTGKQVFTGSEDLIIKNTCGCKVNITGKRSKVMEYKPRELETCSDLNVIQSSIGLAALSKKASRGESSRMYHEEWVSRINKADMKFSAKQIEALKEYNLEYDDKLIILADEPESGLAINLQFGLFEWFYDFAKAYKDRIQIIIATHSIAAFKLAKEEDVNIIELTKGWNNLITNKLYE